MATAAKPIRTIGECYAHALMVEREAAARYREFSDQLEELGAEMTARLFRELADEESRHASLLERMSAGEPLPMLENQEHSWLNDAPPDAVSHELIHHLMTPHDALKIALGAEQRAKRFFEGMLAANDNSALRDLASEMVNEEGNHIRRLEAALASTPAPFLLDESFQYLMDRRQRPRG